MTKLQSMDMIERRTFLSDIQYLMMYDDKNFDLINKLVNKIKTKQNESRNTKAKTAQLLLTERVQQVA
jgi:hypothetical protein